MAELLIVDAGRLEKSFLHRTIFVAQVFNLRQNSLMLNATRLDGGSVSIGDAVLETRKLVAIRGYYTRDAAFRAAVKVGFDRFSAACYARQIAEIANRELGW